MSSYEIETVVIGAGVVGLACAAQLADTGREVLVLERNLAIGEETSARNSEVIHAGMYYPPGSLKAELCVAGKRRIYRYCDAMNVPYQNIGKLIVAKDEDQTATLRELLRRGKQNGVTDLTLLKQSDTHKIEPALRCHAALNSPSTGILDTHQFMLSLQSELENRSGVIAFGSTVKSIRPLGKNLYISMTSGPGSVDKTSGTPMNLAGQTSGTPTNLDGRNSMGVPKMTGSQNLGTPMNSSSGEFMGVPDSAGSNSVGVLESGGEVLVAREVVNCAGHGAVGLAWGVPGAQEHDLPEAYFTRGNYFRMSARAPFSRLIYPTPVPGGLGVHLSFDMAGNSRFGPDVEAVSGPQDGYAVDPARAASFYQSIRAYWPDLPDQALMPDYAGIRPKIRRPGISDQDFEILDQGHHRVPGLIHCLGIESPGLTSSLAIADEVVSRLGQR